MINLKKLFRRKKGQGALEYLFMIAAALIIIFVVVRYISGTGSQASSQVAIASLQSQAELAKTTLSGKGIWDDTYTVTYNTSTDTLKIGTVAIDSNLQYKDYYSGTFTNDTLKNIYENCMNKNDKTYCYVLIDLQDAKKQ